MGWRFPYVSSYGSEFNFDLGVAYTHEEIAAGIEHNLHSKWDHSGVADQELRPAGAIPRADEPPRDGVGMSAFALQDGVVYHTYSCYARGLDALWGMYQWLDRAPLGRNEVGRWYRLRDEYEDRGHEA